MNKWIESMAKRIDDVLDVRGKGNGWYLADSCKYEK